MQTGVYQIRNTVNGKCYIGSAAGRGFRNRWKLHTSDLESDTHVNVILQQAWNKYGSGAFEFVVLERCQPTCCVSREQHWMDRLQPEYNIAPTAGSQLGYRHSEEAKEKIRRARCGKSIPRHRGELHFMSRLDESMVREVRNLLSEGVRQKDIAAKFGIDQSTVSNIKTGRLWGWLK